MPRLDDFIADLVKSGLVQRADLGPFLETLGPGLNRGQDGAVVLAKALIEADALTRYQARKVLGGATRGFFLGGYRVLKPIGEGGMGKVYLARGPDGGPDVAIKVLPPKKAAEERNALDRFLREMDLSRRVVHPNLARTISVGEDDGAHFMVMEFIAGESLYELVKGDRGAPLNVADASRLFVKVLDGLEAAHDAGLVHRDIKPSNIMVTPEGDVRVLDLGLARAIGEEAPLTRPNIVVGTLDYVSPEQLVNASAADARSDLYSVGCAIYFTVAGRPPFEGGDIVNKIFKQRMDDPEPLEKVARGVPAEFAAIVRKLMAKTPSDRYQSAGELRDDLKRWTIPDGEPANHSRRRALRVFDEAVPLGGPSSPSDLSIRDLGDAEAAPATRRPPRVQIVVAVPRRETRVEPAPPFPPWVGHLIALCLVLGLILVLMVVLR